MPGQRAPGWRSDAADVASVQRLLEHRLADGTVTRPTASQTQLMGEAFVMHLAAAWLSRQRAGTKQQIMVAKIRATGAVGCGVVGARTAGQRARPVPVENPADSRLQQHSSSSGPMLQKPLVPPRRSGTGLLVPGEADDDVSDAKIPTGTSSTTNAHSGSGGR